MSEGNVQENVDAIVNAINKLRVSLIGLGARIDVLVEQRREKFQLIEQQEAVIHQEFKIINDQIWEMLKQCPQCKMPFWDINQKK